jgi:hypothetical protein
VNESYGKLPLSFEANEGQQDQAVKFLSRGSGYNLFLTNHEAVLVLTKSEKPAPAAAKKATHAALTQKKPKRQSSVLRTQLVAANPAAKVTGEEELAGKINYLIGKDPSKWRTGVSTYAKVRYEQVYPGIDLVYYGNQRQLEYDFVVGAGADPARIRLKLAGARKMYVDGQGQLMVQTAGGGVRWNRPEIYQEVDGQHRSVQGKYVLGAGHELGFAVAAYDMAKPLIIDPTLVYSTYLGGSASDEDGGIAVDSSGNAYIAGCTQSSDFPTTAGAFQTTYGGGEDIFVTEINPTGSGLVYSTYIGGSAGDEGKAIAVDTSGNAYVTGMTFSDDFPTTPGAFQPTTPYFHSYHAFVTALNPTGAGLYSTYLGGDYLDFAAGIAVDTSGHAYVIGTTGSTDFPTTVGAFQRTYGGGNYDAFLTVFNSTGTGLIYSTYLGGSGYEEGEGIAVDTSGHAYITGITDSSDFATTAGALQTTYISLYANVFVAEFNPTGSDLVFSTYLGAGTYAEGKCIALDTSGNAYVSGLAESGFPVTAGAFQTTFSGGCYDAFITELNPTGSGLLYSTYLGGIDLDQVRGIAVDTSGNAYVSGFTRSSDFPITEGAFQTILGGEDAFVTEINPSGTGLVYSTFLGGSSSDQGFGMAVDTSGNFYVTGFAQSSDFPTTAGAFQTTIGGPVSAFVAKFSTGSTPPLVLTATGHVVNGMKLVRLAWTRATSDYIFVGRNGHKIAEVPNRVGLFTDTLTSAGVYTYSVREVGGLKRFSNKVRVKFRGP